MPPKLVHGCKGSEGTERETVLIASEGVDNKTVPTILCDEDDVAGNHGATIGHVRPDQLFYLTCRGISPAAAEALFLRAKLEDAALTAPTDDARAAGITPDSTLLAEARPLLALQLKGLAARDLWTTAAYVIITAPLDTALQKALAVLRDGTYEEILGTER